MQKIAEVFDDKHSDCLCGGFGEEAFELHNKLRNGKGHVIEHLPHLKRMEKNGFSPIPHT